MYKFVRTSIYYVYAKTATQQGYKTYQLQGDKLLFRDKNKAQKGWICSAKYGVTAPVHHCVIVNTQTIKLTSNTITSHIPDLNPNSNDIDDRNNAKDMLVNDRTRTKEYNPSLAAQSYSQTFQSFIDQSIVQELNDVAENGTHFVGWMHVKSKDAIDRFMWIYQHQGKVVYINRRGGNKTTKDPASDCKQSEHPHPQSEHPHPQSETKSKPAFGVIKTGCPCHILIAYYQVYCDADCTKPHGAVIALCT
eukprot:326471_1